VEVDFVLALDQGTTSSRAAVVDGSGRILAMAQREFRQIFPHPGQVEHDPLEIWESQIGTAREALQRAVLEPADIGAIGITNQRETVVVWDRESGEPLMNAIVWQDRRTAELCDRLEAEGRGELVRSKTGLIIDPYFSASKIAWILDNVDGARARAEQGQLAFGTVDSWLVYKLTGHEVHITDATNASRTMLFDIHAGRWDEELLELFDVPPQMMPEVRSSSEVYGTSVPTTGFGGVRVAGIAGDQQAALAGQLCTRPGQAKNTYGTGCFLLAHTGDEPVTSSHRLLTTIACSREGQPLQYALEGSVFTGGAVVQWLRDGLELIDHSSRVEALAQSVDDNGGVYFVPAFSGLGAPHWNPHARGLITGLTRGSTAGHLARAALEAIAFQVADLVDAIRGDGIEIDELRVDGGAAVNDTLLDFQAGILQVPVVRPAEIETTALGAAYMAGLAVGVWSDESELAGNWKKAGEFEPALPLDRAEELRAAWDEAVRRATL
jgi:glycerol kinase